MGLAGSDGKTGAKVQDILDRESVKSFIHVGVYKGIYRLFVQHS